MLKYRSCLGWVVHHKSSDALVGVLDWTGLVHGVLIETMWMSTLAHIWRAMWQIRTIHGWEVFCDAMADDHRP